ncbi:MAG: Cytochrome P450 monooxygenase orf9 [Claussenomyces sp. TS43310]|nr:MAG: Cytochrome P450 monooxygenase orf9 [Claussenomyces sp. TS43310]
MYGAGFNSLCIGSERDPKAHSRMKKSLSGAFSTKALSEQEDIVQKCVNEFVDRIGKDGAPGTKGLNMTKWYEMVAFDILGEMAFGESFRCIENGKPHFWAELIVDHLYFITVADNLRQYPLLVFLAKLLNPYLGKIREKHTGYTREKVDRQVFTFKRLYEYALTFHSRLASNSSRKDFFTSLAKRVESGEVDKEEMTAHTSTLIIAGGETVSTFLAATTHSLLMNAEVYEKLRKEIRDRYTSYEEIDANSALQLPYLQATISEGLRIYPPGSQGFPRISPGTTIDDHWVPQGAEVYTSAWTVTHDPRNFHNPHRFKPERWLDKDCSDIKEASQPFSLGPRGCLGRNFAYVEMALILAKMHWRYDLELINKDVDWEGQSRLHVMWSKPELWVRFHERAVKG